MGDSEAFALVSPPGTAVLDPPGAFVPTVRRRVPLDPQRHRELVLRRLLKRGVRVRTLMLLLPEWRELIDEVASTICPEGPSAA